MKRRIQPTLLIVALLATFSFSPFLSVQASYRSTVEEVEQSFENHDTNFSWVLIAPANAWSSFKSGLSRIARGITGPSRRKGRRSGCGRLLDCQRSCRTGIEEYGPEIVSGCQRIVKRGAQMVADHPLEATAGLVLLLEPSIYVDLIENYFPEAMMATGAYAYTKGHTKLGAILVTGGLGSRAIEVAQGAEILGPLDNIFEVDRTFNAQTLICNLQSIFDSSAAPGRFQIDLGIDNFGEFSSERLNASYLFQANDKVWRTNDLDPSVIQQMLDQCIVFTAGTAAGLVDSSPVRFVISQLGGGAELNVVFKAVDPMSGSLPNGSGSGSTLGEDGTNPMVFAVVIPVSLLVAGAACFAGQRCISYYCCDKKTAAAIAEAAKRNEAAADKLALAAAASMAEEGKAKRASVVPIGDVETENPTFDGGSPSSVGGSPSSGGGSPSTGFTDAETVETVS